MYRKSFKVIFSTNWDLEARQVWGSVEVLLDFQVNLLSGKPHLI